VLVIGGGSAALTAGVLSWGPALSPSMHGFIIGAGAVLFAVSDGLFARLLTEVNAVLRSSGFSVWQAERIRDIILPFKTKAWLLWWISQGLKAVSAVCAVVLQKQSLSAKATNWLLEGGYFSLFVALACTIWMVRNFRRVEKFRDDLALEEVGIKEKKRLASELQTGSEHDFKADPGLEGYSKPPGPV
jgi:hypothetical protein